MLFSGIPFLYYFLPAVLLCYFLVPHQLKHGVLLFSRCSISAVLPWEKQHSSGGKNSG